MKDDWSFDLDGLAGTHTFQVIAPGQDWVLHSVWRKDQDVTDAGLSFGPNDVVDDITIVVTRTRNELSGSVVDASGRRTGDAWIVVFPSDPALWKWPRWVRGTQTDRRGEFRIDALPAYERYLVAAVPFSVLEAGEWSIPAD